MATIDQTLDSAMRMVGLLAPGRSYSSGTSGTRAAAIDILNAMLSSWQTERLNVPAETATTVTAAASDGDYTVGSGGYISMARPPFIDRASWKIDDVEYPMVKLTDAEYAAWSDKTITGVPVAFIYKPANPLGTLYILPLPSSADSIVIYTPTTFTSYSSGSATMYVTDGYDKAIRYNLALELAAELASAGAMIPPENRQLIERQAREAKSAIRYLNAQPIPLKGTDYPSRKSGMMSVDQIAAGGWLRA